MKDNDSDSTLFGIDERGQAFSLEGLTAALIIIVSVIYALNATAVTPLTASTSNKQIQEQNRILGDDILDTAVQREELVDTVLYYNTERERFYNASRFAYTQPPPTRFGDLVNDTLEQENVVFNVYVSFQTTDGKTVQERLVYQGVPSDNAATATRTVVLYDGMRITSPTTNDRLENADYFAEDIAPNSPVYNVIEVKLVLWKR